MHIFHKWSKWELYEQDTTFYFYKTGKQIPCVDTRQRRKCEGCGKTQDEKVK